MEQPEVEVFCDASNNVIIGISNVTLFPPTSPTTCVCAIGVGATGSGLPAGLAVNDMNVYVFNTVTQQATTVAAFAPLASNAVTTTGFANGAGATAGATWFGFSGVINPFTVPTLGANEEFVLGAETNLTLAQLATFAGQPVQLAAGVGLADGTPDFDDPEHAPQYFTASDPGIMPKPVPEPSSVILASCGLAMCMFRRRRGRNGVK